MISYQDFEDVKSVEDKKKLFCTFSDSILFNGCYILLLLPPQYPCFFSDEIKKEEADGSPLLVDHTSTRERTMPTSKGGAKIGVTK